MSRLKSSGSKDHVYLLGRPFERNPLVRMTLVAVVLFKRRGEHIHHLQVCICVHWILPLACKGPQIITIWFSRGLPLTIFWDSYRKRAGSNVYIHIRIPSYTHVHLTFGSLEMDAFRKIESSVA